MALNRLERLSVNAYAKRIGVDEKTIRKAITAGKIKKGYNPATKKIIPYLADKEYGHIHEVPKAGHGLSREMVSKKLETAENSPKKGTKTGSSPRKSSDTGKKSEESPKNDDDSSEDWAEQDESYEVLLDKLKITSDLKFAEVTRRQAILEAALTKKKLEEMEDVLIRKTIVERSLFSIGIQLKKSIMAVPARIMDDVLAAPDKIEAMNILTEELTSVLSGYADFEKLKLTNK